MKYTMKIHRALKAAVAAWGDYGQKKFSEDSGISAVYINRWLNPDKYHPRTIGDALWEKLLPKIEKYLEEDVDDIHVAKAVTPRMLTATKPEYLGKIINGQINVYGVPNERIISVINGAAFLTKEQKKELILRIFS